MAKEENLEEKQKLILDFEEKRNQQRKDLLNHEHGLKMQRLELRYKIAQITGKDPEQGE